MRGCGYSSHGDGDDAHDDSEKGIKDEKANTSVDANDTDDAEDGDLFTRDLVSLPHSPWASGARVWSPAAGLGFSFCSLCSACFSLMASATASTGKIRNYRIHNNNFNEKSESFYQIFSVTSSCQLVRNLDSFLSRSLLE